MSIKERIAKLEAAQPDDAQVPKLIIRTLVSGGHGAPIVKTPHSARVVGCPDVLYAEKGETQEAFLKRAEAMRAAL